MTLIFHDADTHEESFLSATTTDEQGTIEVLVTIPSGASLGESLITGTTRLSNIRGGAVFTVT